MSRSVGYDNNNGGSADDNDGSAATADDDSSDYGGDVNASVIYQNDDFRKNPSSFL